MVIKQVSEGLDFADHAGRAVVVTGLPFATSTDPKVCLSFPILLLNIFYHS
jgi:Rad3-related DNA helicase